MSVNKLNKARTAFFELCKTLSLSPSSWETKHIEEAVAVAFLVCPERLVWQGQGHPGPACFLGEPLADCLEQGYFVAVLLKSSSKGLQCTLSLSVTDWVVRMSGVILFDRTAKFLSDSTFTEFRAACCLVLRNLGFDLKLWHCRPGARETEFAVYIMLSPQVDLSIVVPNGNTSHDSSRCTNHGG